MAAAERDAKGIVEILVEDTTTAKKVAVPDFDSQNHTSEEIWLIIFQIENFQNPLRTVSQTHEFQ